MTATTTRTRVRGGEAEREAMKERCQEQGHVWVSCMTATFGQVRKKYERCKWCNEMRNVRSYPPQDIRP